MTTHGKRGRHRPKLGKARLPYKERLKRGFARVERDLSWMMGIFRELLDELGEKEAGDALPWVHGAKHLPPIKEGKITRAYAIAFGLLNLAEEVAAAAMRQLNEAINGPQHEPGSWAQALCRLKGSGETAEHLAATLPTLRVEPVLTAHPTEARRRSILACMQEIHGILLERGGQSGKDGSDRERRDHLKTVLERWWRTEEVRTQRPTVDMEREGVIHCLAGSMARSIAETDRRLRDAWQIAGFGLGGPVHPAVRPVLSFGTWVGGDRDGHPLVTPEVTGQSLELYRNAAVQLIASGLERLASHLTLSRKYHGIPAELEKWLPEWRRLAGPEAEAEVSVYQEEPWREAVLLMRRRLLATSSGYRQPDDLILDLGVVRRALLDVGADRLAAAEVLTALDDSRGVAMLLAALGCTRKWFDVDYGELARRRAWTALQYFDITAPFNPALAASQTVDVRQSIHRALEIKTGKAITLPPPFEPDPVNVLYGLEVRSCRRGDAYLRLLADGRLVLGHYDLKTVKLPEELFASLRKELEALRATPDSPFFGMGGCDYECHFLPDERGMRRFMVGLSGRPVGGRRLVEWLGSALDATVGEAEGDAFRDRSAPFGPDDDGS